MYLQHIVFSKTITLSVVTMNTQGIVKNNHDIDIITTKMMNQRLLLMTVMMVEILIAMIIMT